MMLEKFPELLVVRGESFIQPSGKVKENCEAYYSDLLKCQEVM
jgi:hypothetical protein